MKKSLIYTGLFTMIIGIMGMYFSLGQLFITPGLFLANFGVAVIGAVIAELGISSLEKK